MNPQEILDGLDPEQRAAAEALAGPVVILAGAGTGKTRAITHRIAYGVATGQHDPRRTLAVTFTSRAAGELRGRLHGLGVADVAARTFHAAALAQLRHFWGQAVGGSLPEILPSKARPVAQAASSLGLPTDHSLVRDLAAEVEWSKSRLVGPEQYAVAAAEAGRIPPGPASREQVAALLAEYERLMAAAGAMDFEDVLRLTVAILDDSPLIADEVRQRYRWFTVDEFQDVNPLQLRLLRLWLGDRDDLCVVGDASQTIYTFAGATPEYLTGFRTMFPEATEVRLVRSYRCTPQIVDLANRVIAASPVPDPARLVLRSERPAGPLPGVNEYANDEGEAAAVAGDIARLIREGVPPREIAVLFRVNSQSEPLEEALAERGIATVVRDGERYFDRAEVKRAVTLLRGAARADDEGGGDLASRARAVLASMGHGPDRPARGGAVAEAWTNVERLVTLAGDLMESNPGAGLADLVAEIDRRATTAHVPEAEAVTLSSLHGAKGLEWDAVFLVGLTEGMLPIVYATTPEAVEEERRLLYVGVTRARSHLALSWARARGSAAWGSRTRSRFLDELPSAGAASEPLVVRGGTPRGERRRKGPARCRVCGKALVTGEERTLGRCRSCPADVDDALFERLRAWRSEVASRKSVPAYVVFTDATLTALAEQRPDDEQGLLAISGIGRAKLDEYGADLLALLGGDGA